MSAAIRGSGAPIAEDVADRTAHLVDDWSKAWAAAYREASEATLLRGVETEATMNVRVGCVRELRAIAGAEQRATDAEAWLAEWKE